MGTFEKWGAMAPLAPRFRRHWRRLNGVRTDEVHTVPDVRLSRRRAFLTGHRTTELHHAYSD